MPGFDSPDNSAKGDARSDASHLVPPDAKGKASERSALPVVLIASDGGDTAAKHLANLELVPGPGTNADGRKLRAEIKTSAYGSTDRITYLPDGKIKSLISTSLGGSTTSENFGYGPKGQLVFKQTSYSNGAITLQEFDPANGKPVAVERTNHLGGKEREQYDSSTGRLQVTDSTDLHGVRTVAHYQYDSTGQQAIFARQIYDERGELIEKFEADQALTELPLRRVTDDSEASLPSTRTVGDGTTRQSDATTRYSDGTARPTDALLSTASDRPGSGKPAEAGATGTYDHGDKGVPEQLAEPESLNSERGRAGASGAAGAAMGAALIIESTLFWWQGQAHRREVGHYVSPAN